MSLGISQVSPILPLYFHEMGLSDTGAISRWSGASMGITFLIVCLAAPFWGRLADRKGRKITLIRSSLGMATCSILLGFQTTPEGVFLVRTLQGLVSGFYSASVTLIASETPQNHTGWALGIIASFNLAGSLAGPLVGGYLSDVIGIRNDFFIIGALMLLAFALTAILVHENYVPNPLISSTTKGLDINKRKCIVAEEETGKTSKEGVYAGGDAVTGAATVILAMGAGKAGAKGIDEFLSNN